MNDYEVIVRVTVVASTEAEAVTHGVEAIMQGDYKPEVIQL